MTSWSWGMGSTFLLQLLLRKDILMIHQLEKRCDWVHRFKSQSWWRKWHFFGFNFSFSFVNNLFQARFPKCLVREPLVQNSLIWKWFRSRIIHQFLINLNYLMSLRIDPKIIIKCSCLIHMHCIALPNTILLYIYGHIIRCIQEYWKVLVLKAVRL